MILIIWESIPSETKLYLVEPKDTEEEKKILTAHGNFVNCDGSNDGDAALWLMGYLEGEEEFMNSSDPKIPIKIPSCTLVLSGFME